MQTDKINVCIQCFPRNKMGKQRERAETWLNTLDNEGYTPLIRAAENGHHLCLNELIKAGADVNATGSYGYTPLLMASAKDESQCVAALIHAGADVNNRNDSGRTALYGAVIHRNIENIKLLLKSGININQYDIEGYNTLEGHIKRWYRRGIEIDKNNKQISTLLFVAGEKIGSSCKKPDHLKTRVATPTLKHFCRDTIRTFLTGVNPHLNLFSNVYKLGIPPSLVTFLLYDEILEPNF